MFGRKKFYKILYRLYATHSTIIVARNEYQAFRKFKKEVANTGIRPTIISFVEC